MINFYFKNYCNLSEKEKLDVLCMRNLPYVRKNMYNTDVISVDAHLNWLDGLGERIDCIYWAIFANNNLIGALNLTGIDINEQFAEWGFYIDKNCTGMGSLVEYLAMEHFISDMNFSKILACVLQDNKKVYNLHKHKFGYIDAPEYCHKINDREFCGLILTKDNWKNQTDYVKKILLKIFKVDNILWD